MHRAFTLIETVITIALSVVLFLAVTQLYILYQNTIKMQESTLSVQTGVSNISSAVRFAALQADQIVVSHMFSGAIYTSSATTSIFELPSIDETGNVIDGDHDYIGIFASGTQAYELTDASIASTRNSGEKQLTSVLQALLFMYDNVSVADATSVTVEATTSATVRQQPVSAHLREQIHLRNI